MKKHFNLQLFDNGGEGGSGGGQGGNAGNGNGSQGNAGNNGGTGGYSFQQAEEIAQARAERAEKAALSSYFKQQGMSEEEINERTQFCIDRVNLTGSENKFPSELSGGMQKRAAIARAISMNPKYLFCDEPNSGLDPKTSIVIDELLSDITHEYGITTIINTHDMNSVLGIGENIIFVNRGHLDWTGNKDIIYDSTSEALNDFVFATDLFREVKSYISKNRK